MFVIIMNVEICCRIDFVECHDFTILIKMKAWVDIMDVESTGKTTVQSTAEWKVLCTFFV